MRKKTFLSFVLIFLVIITVNADEVKKVKLRDSLTKEYSDYTVCRLELNSKEIDFDTPPILYSLEGKTRTLVPIRAIAENLNWTVGWNGATQTVTILNDKKEIELAINDTTVFINGEEKKILDNVPAMIMTKDGISRTLVPVRFVCEEFGLEVGWEQSSHTVLLTEKNENSESSETQYIDNVEKPEKEEKTEKTEDEEDVELIEIGDDESVQKRENKEDEHTSKNYIHKDYTAKDVNPNNIERGIKYSSDEYDENYIDAISIVRDSNYNLVIIKFDKKYKNDIDGIYLSDETLYFDFENTLLSNLKNKRFTGGSILEYDFSNSNDIDTLRSSQFEFDDDKKKARLVMDLKRRIDYRVERDGNEVLIFFGDSEDLDNLDEKDLDKKSRDKNKYSIAYSLCIEYNVVKNGEYSAINFSPYTSMDLELIEKNPSKNLYKFRAEKSHFKIRDFRNNVYDEFIDYYEIIGAENDELDYFDIVVKTKDGVEVYKNPHELKSTSQEIIMKIPSANTSKSDKMTVVIDPGHGGKDPGAVNKNRNVTEVEIIDKIVPYVREYLEEMGYRVLLTRDSNVYSSLYSRVKYSELVEADVLVSFHANVFNKESVQGIEVFRDYSSPKLAKYIYDGMIAQTSAKERGVKFEDLYITREAVLPSCLLELGFISNNEELDNLLNKEYQKKIAKGIAEGIDNFLK